MLEQEPEAEFTDRYSLADFIQKIHFFLIQKDHENFAKAAQLGRISNKSSPKSEFRIDPG